MLLFAIAVAVGSLHGTVVDVNGALPGVTVTLASGAYSATRVSGARGEYAFDHVPDGVYDVTFELSGFVSEKRRMAVEAGDRAIRPVSMKLDPSKMVVEFISTDGPPCIATRKSRWLKTSCQDYELDDALIAAAQHGDRSSIELLQRRYAEEPVYRERYRIGGALLGRVADDRAIWNELAAHALNCIDDKFEEYCRERDCSASAYASVAWEALDAISPDRRARPLLLRALASKDEMLVQAGIQGFAKQHDESAYAEIEKALQRVPSAALALVAFRSDAADALAKKYLSDEQFAEYAAVRDDGSASPP